MTVDTIDQHSARSARAVIRTSVVVLDEGLLNAGWSIDNAWRLRAEVVKDGDSPVLALLTVLGGNSPAHAAGNEFTTVAPVCTTARFLDGTAIKGTRRAPPIVTAAACRLSRYLPYPGLPCPD